MAYQIEFAKAVKAHLDVLTAGQRSRVLATIERQLTNEPSRETRHRTPLRPNPLAPWELRAQQLRVFYEVNEGPPAVVQIPAVGVQTREALRIGGEEVTL